MSVPPASNHVVGLILILSGLLLLVMVAVVLLLVLQIVWLCVVLIVLLLLLLLRIAIAHPIVAATAATTIAWIIIHVSGTTATTGICVFASAPQAWAASPGGDRSWKQTHAGANHASWS